MPREHGSYACYTSKCAHCPKEDQLRAKNEYDRRVRKLKAYGRWAPMVDAGPVREHVNALRAAGFGGQRIAELAGVPYKVYSALIWGVDGMEPSRQMRPWNAEKLLALQPSPEDRLPRSLTDPTGTRRRLQALQVIGWSQAELARRAGIVRVQVGNLSNGHGRYVFAETERTVRGLYEDLWDQVPPQETPQQKRAVTIARRVAREHGWAPPMAWDENIDDPTAEPEGAGADKRRGKLPSAEDLDWLVQGGDSIEVLADRYGTSTEAVRLRLNRAEKKVAA